MYRRLLQSVLERLAEHIYLLSSPHPLPIAVDGIDAAGKTTLADELGALLETRGRPVIRASSSCTRFRELSVLRRERGDLLHKSGCIDA